MSWVASEKLLNLFAKGRRRLRTFEDYLALMLFILNQDGGVGLKLWVLERGGDGSSCRVHGKADGHKKLPRTLAMALKANVPPHVSEHKEALPHPSLHSSRDK